MDTYEATPTQLTFVGGSGAGKTSLLSVITKGYFPDELEAFFFDSLYIKHVYFNPSSYQPACNRVIEMTEPETGRPKDRKMLAGKWQTFQLKCEDCEDYDARRVLSYPGAAVIALCFSVAKREEFDLIRTRWYPEIRHFAPHAQLVIVGTMTDLRSLYYGDTLQSTVVATSGSHDPVSYYEGCKLAKELRASYVECSAMYHPESVDEVWKTMLWRWHEFGDQKKSRRGAGECILQ